MIIICYDGSQHAQAAADQAIRLFHDKPATVITVREPHTKTLIDSGLGLGSGFGLNYERTAHTADVDAQLRERAQQTAQEGARRLRAAGMTADWLVEERHGSVAKTVLATAGRIDAEAVVVGTRGRGETKSALLGSVSRDLVQHANCAVLIVPSHALVGRHRKRRLPQAT